MPVQRFRQETRYARRDDFAGCLSACKVDIRLGTVVRVTALTDTIDVAELSSTPILASRSS
jgi:hypothetical protein